MDDLAKLEADLVADLWKRIERMERRLRTVRAALERGGPGSSLTSVAQVVAEEGMELAIVAGSVEGVVKAARLM